MKEETDNVEIYFICDRKEEMDLVESFYDEEDDIHYWYFNAYLAYQEWKNNFKYIEGELTKTLLTVAASKYLIYRINKKDFLSKEEHKEIKKNLKRIKPRLNKIIEENKMLSDL